MDGGGHGIYDFVHRDPHAIPPKPMLSIAKTEAATRTLNLGSWIIPLTSGKVMLQRKGKAFWQILNDHGVPTTVFRIPANFPPVETDGESLSGMGTPDLLGTPGTFSYYTDNPPEGSEDFSGGRVIPVQVIKNHVHTRLEGPANLFRRVPKKRSRRRHSKKKIEYENPVTSIDFDVYMDADNPVAKIEIQDQEFILKEGEWSDWVRIDFKAVPMLVSFSGVARFYLQEVRPDFKLYITPIQINPEDPVMPISTPADWSCDLSEKLGYFYTQEMPEDTKALTNGIFSGHEFKEQANYVFRERRHALDYLLDHFKDGLLFVYFSSIDQQSHMLWRYTDPNHPGYDPTEHLEDGILDVYQEIDEALGRAFQAVDDDTTLVVMSDHGFCPFYWGVNLNSWLVEKGYVKLRKPEEQGKHKFFLNVDWSRTTAYALGLNGLYVNLKGREKAGIVNPGREYEDLLDRLETDLLAMRDPKNGRQVVTLVTRPGRDFHGPYKNSGPDILVGYARDYRSSWESPLDEFPKDVIVVNDKAWSADHCIDYRVVPGVLLTNKKITLDSPSLTDLTVGVLDEFGVPPLPEMIGKDCLGPRDNRRASADKKE